MNPKPPKISGVPPRFHVETYDAKGRPVRVAFGIYRDEARETLAAFAAARVAARMVRADRTKPLPKAYKVPPPADRPNAPGPMKASQAAAFLAKCAAEGMLIYE